jgi:hypothetical protein
MKGIFHRIFKEKKEDVFQDISVYQKQERLASKRRKVFLRAFFFILVVVALLLVVFCVLAFFDTQDSYRDDIDDLSVLF